MNTDKGLLPIEQLKVGDMVLSAPANAIPSLEGELETVYKVITHIFKSQEKQYLKAPLGNPAVICEIEHLFWTKEKGWIIAHDLEYSTSVYLLTPPLDHPHFFQNSFLCGSMHGDNQKYLSMTNFKGIVVGFENNDSYGWHDRWTNNPYIKNFNNDKYIKLWCDSTLKSEKEVIYEDADDFSDKLTERDLTEQEVFLYEEVVKDVIINGNTQSYKDIVYDIRVAEYNTYFVGKRGVWVRGYHSSIFNLNNLEPTSEVSTDWQQSILLFFRKHFTKN